MTSKKFTKKDYDNLLKAIQNYHLRQDITASVEVCELIIKGILTGNLVIKIVK